MIKNLTAMWETWDRSLDWEYPLEKGMAIHSSVLAWRIPMDRGARWATVHEVAKSRTRLSGLSTHTQGETYRGFQGGVGGKEPACQCRRYKRCCIDSWVRKIFWRTKWQPTLVFLAGESHGWRNLASYSPQGQKEFDMTEKT